jgi:hypothetical protein
MKNVKVQPNFPFLRSDAIFVRSRTSIVLLKIFLFTAGSAIEFSHATWSFVFFGSLNV